MKIRLLLVVFLSLPLFMKGQSDVKFYSKGKMYIQYKPTNNDGTDSESTTLYILGSAKFATGSAIEQKGRTELTGDFINAKDPNASAVDDPTPRLFTGIDATNPDQNEGVIAFIAKGTRQAIYGVNNAAVPVKIDHLTEVDTWRKQKEKNTIWFPTIHVNKGGSAAIAANGDWRELGYVEVEPSAAVEVQYLNVPHTDRFSILVARDATFIPGRAADPRRVMNSGHALIKGVHSSMDADAKASFSQLRFDYYKWDGEGAANDDGAFNASGVADMGAATRNTLRLKDGDGLAWNYLTGFTPPFSEMGADYMFYNVLTKPNATSITSWEGPVVDPFFRMKAGRGYFMSMEVSHADYNQIDARWDFEGDGGTTGIDHARRARGGYTFNRMVYQNFLANPNLAGGSNTSAGSMSKMSRFLYKNADYMSGDAYGATGNPIAGLGVSTWIEKGKDRSRYELMTNEKFLMTEPITIELEKGLNFLGNPFMTPISLNPLLGYENDGTEIVDDTDAEDPFAVDVFKNGSTVVTASSAKITADLRAKYWVINQALVRYDAGDNLFHYKNSYDFVSRGAGASANSSTVTGAPNGGVHDQDGDFSLIFGDPLKYRIAPMQMFCLQASKPVTISLNPSLRVFAEPARLPKSARSSVNSVMRDWFVVEVVNRDSTTDRTTVVFHDKAQYANDAYDTSKGLTKQLEQFVDVYNNKSTQTKPEAVSGIVYTKSSDGEKLLGNAIPKNTKEVALYYDPIETVGEVTLRFYGIENLEAVPDVWLVDKFLDNKTIKLEQGSQYTFVSNPSDLASTEDSRFILRFYNNDNIIVNKEETVVTAYYNESVLHVLGLNEDDMNSDLQVYDLQGRLVGKTKITETPSMTYMKPLSHGTYIVKISGKRNHTIKIVNLRN